MTITCLTKCTEIREKREKRGGKNADTEFVTCRCQQKVIFTFFAEKVAHAGQL